MEGTQAATPSTEAGGQSTPAGESPGAAEAGVKADVVMTEAPPSGVQPLISGMKVPTEAELMGEEAPSDDDAAAATGKEQGGTATGGKAEGGQGTPAATAGSPAKTEGTPAQAAQGDRVSPPPGYVPVREIQAERARRQAVASQLEDANRRIAEIELRMNTQPPKTKQGDGQQVTPKENLTKEQWVEKFREEPEETFAKLVEQMNSDKEAIKDEITVQREAQEVQRRVAADNAVAQEAVALMAEHVPGITDPDGELNQQLSQFAFDHGLNNDFMRFMSDPRTQILPPGAKRPLLLGHGASSLVITLHNLYNKLRTSDPSVVRQSVEKELRDTITKEVLAKLKTGASGKAVSLTEAPSATEPPASKRTVNVKNTSQYAKLSEADRERWLMGDL